MGTSRHTPLRIAFRRPWPTTRRGFKLWLFSVVIGLRGVLYVSEPGTNSAALQFPTLNGFDPLNTQRWGVVIVVACAVAIWSSYRHYGRDRYGYSIMAGLATLWGMFYMLGLVGGAASNAAVQGVLSMFLLVVLLLHCSGDPEMPQAPR